MGVFGKWACVIAVVISQGALATASLHTGNLTDQEYAKKLAAEGARQEAPKKPLQEHEIKFLDSFSQQGVKSILQLYGRTLPLALEKYVSSKDVKILAPDTLKYAAALSSDAKKKLKEETQKILDEDTKNPKAGSERDERFLGLVKGLNMAVKSLLNEKPSNKDEEEFAKAAKDEKKKLADEGSKLWNVAKEAANGNPTKKAEFRELANRAGLAGWLKQHCSSSSASDRDRCALVSRAYESLLEVKTDDGKKKYMPFVDMVEADGDIARAFTGNNNQERVAFWSDAGKKDLFRDASTAQNPTKPPQYPTAFYYRDPNKGVVNELPPEVPAPPKPAEQVAAINKKQTFDDFDNFLRTDCSTSRCHTSKLVMGENGEPLVAGKGAPTSLAQTLETLESGGMPGVTRDQIESFRIFKRKIEGEANTL